MQKGIKIPKELGLRRTPSVNWKSFLSGVSKHYYPNIFWGLQYSLYYSPNNCMRYRGASLFFCRNFNTHCCRTEKLWFLRAQIESRKRENPFYVSVSVRIAEIRTNIVKTVESKSTLRGNHGYMMKKTGDGGLLSKIKLYLNPNPNSNPHP